MSSKQSLTLTKWHPIFDKANFIVFTSPFFAEKYLCQEVSFREMDISREDYPRASLRAAFIDDQKRQFSIKQFHYDWASPAYDCPSLWHNPKYKRNVQPRPFLIGNDVLWIGINYRDQTAASLITHRTCIEINLLEGEFKDEEWIELAKSLHPLDLSKQSNILQKTYAEQSFQYPDRTDLVNVPYTFWKTPSENNLRYQTAYAWKNMPTVLKDVLHTFGYHPDTLFTYSSENPNPADARIEFVLEHDEYFGSCLRMIVVDKNSTNAYTYPPEPDETQLFKWEKVKVKNRDVYYAYRSPEFGPHQAIWQCDKAIYLLLVKPAKWTDREWFLKLLASMIK